MSNNLLWQSTLPLSCEFTRGQCVQLPAVHFVPNMVSVGKVYFFYYTMHMNTLPVVEDAVCKNSFQK